MASTNILVSTGQVAIRQAWHLPATRPEGGCSMVGKVPRTATITPNEERMFRTSRLVRMQRNYAIKYNITNICFTFDNIRPWCSLASHFWPETLVPFIRIWLPTYRAELQLSCWFVYNRVIDISDVAWFIVCDKILPSVMRKARCFFGETPTAHMTKGSAYPEIKVTQS